MSSKMRESFLLQLAARDARSGFTLDRLYEKVSLPKALDDVLGCAVEIQEFEVVRDGVTFVVRVFAK